MSVKSCMQLMSLSKSMHHTYFSSTIALSGATINCCLNVAPQAGFCERLLADNTYGCLLCLSGVVSRWGIHDVGHGSSCSRTFWRVLGASQVFICEILVGDYFDAWYQPEDFKQMDKSCLLECNMDCLHQATSLICIK